MSSNNQSETIVPGPYGTGGYMLSVKVSSHPALAASDADAPMSTSAYNFTVNTTPAADDGTVITLTYYHGTTDITNDLDTYFMIVTSSGGCTTATPPDMPTSVTTTNGTSCFTFEKQSAYTSDHTFKINASGADAENSPTTSAF